MSLGTFQAVMKKNTIERHKMLQTMDMESREEPGELVLRMAKSPEDRRQSHVRWSVQKDIFITGHYPFLSWNLYVKLVELKLSGERLAMKVMEKDKCPRTLRMKELHAFLQIGVSPFIVRFHSCFQTDTACYLLMQYHCGGSLAKIIEEFGVLSEDTARDIKLANILLGVDNHVRICDMGLCKLGMTGNTKTHTRCGALRYCAPEVLARDWYSKEVDWWSLGVVLYRMLTGQYPFDASSRDVIEEMIKNDDPNLDVVPLGDARDIIDKFLQKQAIERLGTGDDAERKVRSHPFFRDINWEFLQTRKLKAPSVQKRFMRRGSIIRKLAFGTEDPNATRSRQIMGRVFHILLRLLILSVIVGLVIILSSSQTQDAVKAYMTQVYQDLQDAAGNARRQLEAIFVKVTYEKT